MRVALLIDRWWPRRGGAELSLVALAERLLELGHEVVAVAEHGPRAGEASPCDVRRIRPGGWSRAARQRALDAALRAGAAEWGADVTVGVRHLSQVDVLWMHGGAHRVSLEARARSRGRAATGRTGRRHRVFLELERAALTGGARVVVVPSKLVEAELRSEYGDRCAPVVCAPPGVDLERFHPRARAAARRALRGRVGLADGVPLLVLPARNPELKGARELLAALRALTDRPWHLCLAGVRSPAPWRRTARRAGFGPERVSVLGDTDGLELAAGADLCCLPTWRDTAGLVLLEALAAGTPVLTSRFAGLADLVTTPELGVVVADPADTGALAAALATGLDALPLSDPGQLHALVAGHGSRAALERVVDVVEQAGAGSAAASR